MGGERLDKDTPAVALLSVCLSGLSVLSIRRQLRTELSGRLSCAVLFIIIVTSTLTVFVVSMLRDRLPRIGTPEPPFI